MRQKLRFSFQTLESELICATAYVELFIRRISEPRLLAVFLRFIFTDNHDGKPIVDIMVHRLSYQSQVGPALTIRESRPLISLFSAVHGDPLVFRDPYRPKLRGRDAMAHFQAFDIAICILTQPKAPYPAS